MILLLAPQGTPGDSGGFQSHGFQGPPGFQQFADVTSAITQTLPSLTQALTGRIVVPAEIVQTLPSLTQLMQALSGDTVAGGITQTLPSLTQVLTAVTTVVEEEPGIGGGVFLGPGFMRPVVRVKISQTLPALTQSMVVDVNDDELVLMLILV